MRAVIDSEIRLWAPDLEQSLFEQIVHELSPRNPRKDTAMAEMLRGAEELDDRIALFRREGNWLLLPRGYVHRLEELAGQFGERVEWESEMTVIPPAANPFRDWKPFQLRDYQEPARDAMLDWAQGILQCPVGGGKTTTALEFIRWAGQKTLVIVGKAALARQWQEEARDHYGYETGYIGEGIWDEKELTIALWQTLWSRRGDLQFTAGSFGCVILDEVHHSAAASLSEIAGMLPAFYRIGCSATPNWDPLLFPIIQAVIGPVIHKTSYEDIGDKLIKPKVVVVETDFQAEYHGTRYEGRRRISNNYSEIMAKLCADPTRNRGIAHIAEREARQGHHVLVVTRRVEHVKALKKIVEAWPNDYATYVLTGAQTGKDARDIAEKIENSAKGSILISTVAEEALNIPKLDRLIMAFPLRRLPLVEQQIGRIMRTHPSKNSCIVYDISDPHVNVLRSQKRDRVQFYMRRGWEAVKFEDPVRAR